MYFSLLPNLKYDKKPIQYPFSESDYVTVKNFFKRFQINPDVFSYTTLFQKYTISEGERVEVVAERAYGNPLYDWVIVLTNNLINPSFDWPLSGNDLRKHIEKNYEDPYTNIRHYEIVDEETQIENFGKVLYPPGTRVDETFYNTSRRFVADTKPEYIDPTLPRENTIYDFSGSNTNINPLSLIGTLIKNSGTGLGDLGGFKIGRHLAFSGSSNNIQRSVSFNPLDCRNVYEVSIRAIRGSDLNGGETPDAAGEDLRLLYRTDSSPWVEVGTIIDISPTDPKIGEVLKTYSLEIPDEAKTTNTYFRLYQSSNNGLDFDHYGITRMIFKRTPPPIPTYTTYEIVNSTYHIIDGVDWIYENNTWKRRVSTGIKFNDNGVVTEISGSDISLPVTEYEYETRENEAKREIYLLKPSFLNTFIDDFKKQAKYKKSSSFVSAKLKETNT